MSVQSCEYCALSNSLTSIRTSTSIANGHAITSTCLYCGCTVCGQKCVGDEATTIGNKKRKAARLLMCGVCHSQTHNTCARDPFTNLPLDAVTLARVMSVSVPTSFHGRAPRASSPTTSSAMPTGGGTYSLTSSFSTMLPPRQKATEGMYVCSLDCALGVTVCVNPQFDASLSADIESALAKRWTSAMRTAWRSASGAAATSAGVKRGREAKEERESATAVQEYSSVDNSSTFADAQSKRRWQGSRKVGVPHELHEKLHCDKDDGKPVVEEEESVPAAHVHEFPFSDVPDSVRPALVAAFLQLRYEGWCEYVEVEQRTRVHQPQYIPKLLDLPDHVQDGVTDLLCPRGQALHLYLLSPSEFPVGSAVALPDCRQLLSGVRAVRAGSSNSFLAETAEAMMKEVAEVVTVAVHGDDTPKIKVGRRAGKSHDTLTPSAE